MNEIEKATKPAQDGDPSPFCYYCNRHLNPDGSLADTPDLDAWKARAAAAEAERDEARENEHRGIWELHEAQVACAAAEAERDALRKALEWMASLTDTEADVCGCLMRAEAQKALSRAERAA